MGWFQSLISGGVNKVVDSVGTAIDKLVTSDEEKLQLHNELAKIKLEAELNVQKMELEADAKVEDEISKRCGKLTRFLTILLQSVLDLLVLFIFFSLFPLLLFLMATFLLLQ